MVKNRLKSVQLKHSISMQLLFCLLLSASFVNAQPQQKIVTIRIAPDRADWTYKVGEKPEFQIDVQKSNVNLQNVKISYEYGKETLVPLKKETLVLKDGSVRIRSLTLTEPGFLRLKVQAEIEGRIWEEYCTAAFEPEKIRPTVEMPTDFDAFWQKALEENAQIPPEPKMELQPDRSTDKVDVYHVSFQSYRKGSRIYGWLAMPKAAGKYPAILRVPGAGVWKNGPDISNAEKGIIVLSIGIHGIPLTMDNSVYEILRTSALWSYWFHGIDDLNRYYYKRVYMGCVSANSFIAQLPAFNGRLGVIGDSQGGALATVTAALDDRVQVLGGYYPALCDLTGYLYNRAGGWPHVFKGADPLSPETMIKKKVTAYYDAVNFARNIRVPAFYTWGYNDLTCPPTSYYSAYNEIKTEKQVFVVPETGHWTYPEQRAALEQFVIGRLSF
jgi:cephalosporin-C deacetylase-like acetyl esterase